MVRREQPRARGRLYRLVLLCNLVDMWLNLLCKTQLCSCLEVGRTNPLCSYVYLLTWHVGRLRWQSFDNMVFASRS